MSTARNLAKAQAATSFSSETALNNSPDEVVIAFNDLIQSLHNGLSAPDEADCGIGEGPEEGVGGLGIPRGPHDPQCDAGVVCIDKFATRSWFRSRLPAKTQAAHRATWQSIISHRSRSSAVALHFDDAYEVLMYRKATDAAINPRGVPINDLSGSSRPCLPHRPRPCPPITSYVAGPRSGRKPSCASSSPMVRGAGRKSRPPPISPTSRNGR